MKHIIKYLIVGISKKLNLEMRLSIDDSRVPVYKNELNGISTTSFKIYPTFILSIIREGTTDEDGRYIKAEWNPNDAVMMTKFALPVFYNELNGIYNDMKIPDLYKYHGKELKLNEKRADEIRRVFMISRTMVELSTVVITDEDVNGDAVYAEGIKIKFNNELSSVTLGLNDVASLLWHINHLDIDNLALNLYNAFYKNSSEIKSENNKPFIDIELPKRSYLLDEEEQKKDEI